MDQTERQRLALIELQGRDGRIERQVDVWQWPLTLGRALDNDVVIDDPHVAAHHARLSLDADGQLLMTALPSKNGVTVNGKRAGDTTPLVATGAQLQLGTARLRLRLAGETLAPEQPLPGGAGMSRGSPWLAGVAAAALLAAGHWVVLDPGADFSAWLPLLLGMPVILALWCGFWALASKIFQHRFDFSGHLRTVLPWVLAMLLVDLLWPQLAAAIAAPRLWALAMPLQGLLLALLVRAHLAHVLPQHQRAVGVTVAAFLVAGASLSAALSYRATGRITQAPYMSTLPPPALRWAATVPSATLVDEMAPLAERLTERARKAREDEPDEGEASDGSD